MSKSDTVRLGVIGAGFIGKVHCNEFKAIPGVELAGVCDFLPARAEALATELGVKKAFKNAEELIADKSIDAVVVAVPNQYHASLTVLALQAGKHVLVEKPMALNAVEAKRIVDAQRKARKTVMVAHQMRWEGLSQIVRKQAEDGAFGRIYNIKAGWWRRCGIPGWGSWFTRMSESGGGPLIDIGVHMLDLSLWLAGSPKPVSVFGSTYAEFGPKRKGLGTWGTPEWDGRYDVEDLATAMVRLDNGATLTLEVSWAVNTDSDQKPFIHLMGTEGGASIYGDCAKLVGQQFGRSFSIDVAKPGNVNPRSELSKHFIECVRTGKEPISSAASGLLNNQVLDSIYESAKTGKLIEIA